MLKRLAHFGQKINIDKCDFAVSKLALLCYVIDTRKCNNLAIPSTNIVAASPKIHPFNYYRRFIPSCAHVLTTLTLTTNASSSSIVSGNQEQNCVHKQISFFSVKLNITQQEYSTFSGNYSKFNCL